MKSVEYFIDYINKRYRETKNNKWHPLRIVVEWDILYDPQPKKFTYYDWKSRAEISVNSHWRGLASDLNHILHYPEQVVSISFLINKNDPYKEEKIAKYKSTFGKYPHCSLGIYSNRTRWIKKNEPNFNIFIGCDSRVKDENDRRFRARTYFIPDYLYNELEKTWLVFPFSNENICLTDKDISKRAEEFIEDQEYKKWWQAEYKKSGGKLPNPADYHKKVKNKSQKTVSQQRSSDKENGGRNSNISPGVRGFLWGAGIILTIGLIIWFLRRRRGSDNIM